MNAKTALGIGLVCVALQACGGPTMPATPGASAAVSEQPSPPPPAPPPPAPDANTDAPDANSEPEPTVVAVAPPAPCPALSLAQPAARQDEASVSLSIVVDRSGSMAGPRIRAAWEGVKKAVGALRSSDWVQLITFDSTENVLVPMQKVRDARAAMSALPTLEAGGGTDLAPALAASVHALAQRPSKVRRIVLLTDGQFPLGCLPSLEAAAHAHDIRVSVVAVGDTVDREVLRQLAAASNGRAHFITEPDALPRIFESEAREALDAL